jgi:hypothetical protein
MQVEAPSALDAMALDIHLTTRDIIVDNNYGQLALFADVRLGGTVAHPALLGRAEAREGGRIFSAATCTRSSAAVRLIFQIPRESCPTSGSPP